MFGCNIIAYQQLTVLIRCRILDLCCIVDACYERVALMLPKVQYHKSPVQHQHGIYSVRCVILQRPPCMQVRHSTHAMLSLLVNSALYKSIFSFNLTLRSGACQSLRTEDLEQCLKSLRTEVRVYIWALLCKHMPYLAASPSRTSRECPLARHFMALQQEEPLAMASGRRRKSKEESKAAPQHDGLAGKRRLPSHADDVQRVQKRPRVRMLSLDMLNFRNQEYLRIISRKGCSCSYTRSRGKSGKGLRGLASLLRPEHQLSWSLTGPLHHTEKMIRY